MAWSTIVGIIGWLVVPVWVAPAIYYNLDWSEHGALIDNACAVVFIVAAALCFLGLHWIEDKSIRRLAIVLGIGLTLNNSWNALENIANIDNRRVDDRKAQIVALQDRLSTRQGWSTIVETAKRTVGDAAATQVEADLQQLIARNATKWQATQKCDPLLTTKSRDFCADVARLQGMVAAAKSRDDALAKLEADRQSNAGRAAPTHADNMAATVATLLAPFNVKATPDIIEGIRAWRGATKTFWLEAQAAVMPAIWLAIVDTLIAAIKTLLRLWSANAARAAKARERRGAEPSQPGPAKAPEPAISVTHGKATPAFKRFCADDLEVSSDHSIAPAEAFKAWCEWCKRYGVAAGSQKRFGEMMTELGATSGWQRGGPKGYQKYMGVRIKPRRPMLAVNNS